MCLMTIESNAHVLTTLSCSFRTDQCEMQCFVTLLMLFCTFDVGGIDPTLVALIG